MLADSQPLTDTQIQRTLLREMAGLSCTALDADSEPCSPTRLLHNIERQVGWRSDVLNKRRVKAGRLTRGHSFSAERSAQPDRQQPDVSARLFAAVQTARHLRSGQDGFCEVANAKFTASNIHPAAACTLMPPPICLAVLCKGLFNCWEIWM